MTEKLFYEDSHMINFSAIVLACQKVGDYYEAVLDRTAFFPEGGGQSADTGIIDGVKVIDAREKEGIIYHKMGEPLELGKRVQGEINWEERFSKMQQHSGEHIVSGLVHAAYGYDNVGFHMGTDAITIDFNGGLTKEQLSEIERKANEAVVANLDVQVMYPTKEELANIYYRSKIEIEGQVRLVTIPGHDACACCAPHVKKTGEIGIIKFLGLQNYKGGVRVSMLCGFRALEDYEAKTGRMKNLSVMMSAPEEEVVSEVERLKNELSESKIEIARLNQRILEYRVESIESGQDMVLIFDEQLDGNGPREFVNLLVEKDISVAAVFAQTGEGQYRYVVGSKTLDVRPFAKYINEQFSGRGGGKPEMVQGSLTGCENAIREAMKECRENLR